MDTLNHRKVIVAVLLVALVVSVFSRTAVYAQENNSDQPADMAAAGDYLVYLPKTETPPEPLCRFGVNNDITNYYMDPLRTGWFINYSATKDPSRIRDNLTYFPIIRLTQGALGTTNYEYSIWSYWKETTEAQLRTQIAKRPGSHWLIGNEPDRVNRTRGGQDDIEPLAYAAAFHELYYIIKEVDPTAQVIAGNIVQATELRIKWLSAVVDAYEQMYSVPMPAEAWAIHAFNLNEVNCDSITDPDLLWTCWGAETVPGIADTSGQKIDLEQSDSVALFIDNIVRMREWMTANGYQGYPLYVTEYGILPGPEHGHTQFDYPRVSTFMDETFDYMLNTTDMTHGDPSDGYRLVQRFSWYSAYDTDFNGSLFDGYGFLADFGQHYASATEGIKESTDFYPVTFTGAQTGTGIELHARIANSGNTEPLHGVIVRFYDGNPDYSGTQIGPAVTKYLQGCGDDVEVVYQWPMTVPGTYQLFVQVTPADGYFEEDTSNNLLGEVVTYRATQSTHND